VQRKLISANETQNLRSSRIAPCSDRTSKKGYCSRVMKTWEFQPLMHGNFERITQWRLPAISEEKGIGQLATGEIITIFG
jgi:hypothetical protein